MKPSASRHRSPIVLAAAALLLVAAAAPSSVADSAAAAPKRPAELAFKTVSVELPGNDVDFPPGQDADLANGQCLICHSAGMVLRQPPLTKDQWRAEVVKMRTVFGALVPDAQVDALTEYLYRINGR